jgi:hypothetical protein
MKAMPVPGSVSVMRWLVKSVQIDQAKSASDRQSVLIPLDAGMMSVYSALFLEIVGQYDAHPTNP